MSTVTAEATSPVQAVIASSGAGLIPTLVQQVKDALVGVIVRPVKPLPRLPVSPAPASASKVTLALSDMTCKQQTAELGEGKDEMVVTGVVFTEALVPHVIGPYNVGAFAKPGESKGFDPLGELATLPLNSKFPHQLSTVICGVEFDGHTGPGTVAAILEHATKFLAVLAERSQLKLDALQVVTIIGQVYTQVASLIGLVTKADEIFQPDSAKVQLVSAAAPFGKAGFTSPSETLTLRNAGLARFGDYRANVVWVAR
ncbi:MAG TPA: hypothetical protein VNN80_36165 [Polyangiaceae bacterium]|nr:hypothetical protein [Polyangiaceae bacterium]